MRQLTPDIYDLAFSYRDYGNEADHMEYNWQRAARTENSRILDIGCGTGGHLEQFNLRGYECAGLDLSSEMIAFCRNKFSQADPAVELFEKDMRDFTLEKKYGLAINMLTAVNMITTNEAMVNHLRSVGNVLDPGGVYILEMYHPREYASYHPAPARSWEIIREDRVVQAELHYDRDDIDPLQQTQKSTLKVTVIRDDDEQVYYWERSQRVYLYLEFLALAALSGMFEPIVCYGTFNSSIILDNSRRSWRMIHVLRRKPEDTA